MSHPLVHPSGQSGRIGPLEASSPSSLRDPLSKCRSTDGCVVWHYSLLDPASEAGESCARLEPSASSECHTVSPAIGRADAYPHPGPRTTPTRLFNKWFSADAEEPVGLSSSHIHNILTFRILMVRVKMPHRRLSSTYVERPTSFCGQALPWVLVWPCGGTLRFSNLGISPLVVCRARQVSVAGRPSPDGREVAIACRQHQSTDSAG